MHSASSDNVIKTATNHLKTSCVISSLALVTAVRNMGIDVLELPPDESNAASVFTQDLSVVVNGIALMCRPSASKDGKNANKIRQIEVDTMRSVLKKELNQAIVEPR